MYKGKRLMKKQPRRWNRSAALLVCLLLALGCTVGGTLAYIFTNTSPVKNIFQPTEVTTTVDEDFDGETKSNVKIQNTGSTDAWLRAAVVVTWQNAAGEVYGKAPVQGTDYSITYNVSEQVTSDKWVKGADGFYYWPSPVAPTEKSGVLITECKLADTANAPDGYTLAVEILGSGIQSKPAGAFNDSWASSGLKVNAAGTALEKVTGGAGA